jgi:hypothetical protein
MTTESDGPEQSLAEEPAKDNSGKEHEGPGRSGLRWFTSKLAEPTIVAAVISLGGVLISTGGAYFGAHVATSNATSGLSRQIEEERSRQTREKRANVYAAFLSAVRKLEDVKGRSFVYAAYKACGDPGLAPYPPKKVSDSELNNENVRYAETFDQVYVYGSNNAWSSAMHVDHEFAELDKQLAAGGECSEELNGEKSRFVPMKIPNVITTDALEREIHNFMGVMCQELVAEPRSGCK